VFSTYPSLPDDNVELKNPGYARSNRSKRPQQTSASAKTLNF